MKHNSYNYMYAMPQLFIYFFSFLYSNPKAVLELGFQRHAIYRIKSVKESWPFIKNYVIIGKE